MHDLPNPGVAVGVGERTAIMSKFEYADDAALVDADAAAMFNRMRGLEGVYARNYINRDIT